MTSIVLRSASRVFLLFSFIVTASAPAQALPFFKFGGDRCEALFEPPKSVRPKPLAMQEKYIGEDVGAYVDPLTNEKWMVRYFSKHDRKAFEIFAGGGLFVNRKGQRINSEFDTESLHFQEGLFVVDKKMRMYFYPRDVRGRIHHSSLIAGDDVMFAGMAGFMEGRLRALNDMSGHYLGDSERTRWFVRELFRRGADLSMLILSGRVTQYYGNGGAALDAKEVQRFILNR